MASNSAIQPAQIVRVLEFFRNQKSREFVRRKMDTECTIPEKDPSALLDTVWFSSDIQNAISAGNQMNFGEFQSRLTPFQLAIQNDNVVFIKLIFDLGYLTYQHWRKLTARLTQRSNPSLSLFVEASEKLLKLTSRTDPSLPNTDQAERLMIEFLEDHAHPRSQELSAPQYDFTLNARALEKVDLFSHWITPLHLAIRNDRQALIPYFLQYGADVNAQDDFGQTPLHYCVQFGRLNMLRELITFNRRMVDLEVSDALGQGVLHRAAWKGDLEMVRFLVEVGADKRRKDRKRRTPLDLAREKQFVPIINELQR